MADLREKQERFQKALDQFVERLQEDRNLLAAVLVGSLEPEHLWRRDSLHLWLIETDGVQKRHRSDGEAERLFRTLVENDINLHCELIPRSRFRKMLEGSSRTAFDCSFFAQRQLLFSQDSSLSNWFEQANTKAVKDQQKELVAISSWSIYLEKHARRLLQEKDDVALASQRLLESAHAVAATLVVASGEVYEGAAIDRALPHYPELFQVLYLDLLVSREERSKVEAALQALAGFLDEHAQSHLKPVLDFLKKKGEVVPLSLLNDHFAYTQLYPWHLEAACEWLCRRELLGKVSAPYKLTKKSRVEMEEPAYLL